MLSCYTLSAKKTTPIFIFKQFDFSAWLKKQTSFTKNWLETNNFQPELGGVSLVPDEKGRLACVLVCLTPNNLFWPIGGLPFLLPEGNYHIDIPKNELNHYALVWGLGAYQFTDYKKTTRKPAKLFFSNKNELKEINSIVNAIYQVRNLINMPTEDLGPSEFAAYTKKLCKMIKADFKQIVGENLLKQNYPLIYAVGRACDDPPRLVDIRWGHKKNPKVVLVGKGVCFDSGGLDIKNSSGMLLMKKDMGGAAQVIGLAQMIVDAKLPINLRLLIPMVENSVSGNAYRPGDIIKSRKGITVEIGNTDAEGRLVLADALTEAVNDSPDLIIDISTLTGAARVALGTDLPALFSNNDRIAADIIEVSNQQMDPVWRLPLFSAYRDSLNSCIADINNAGTDSYAGAITAALFLKEFVPDSIPWVHLDLMAWNLKSRPGRPQGGEAMAIRTLFYYLKNIFLK